MFVLNLLILVDRGGKESEVNRRTETARAVWRACVGSASLPWANLSWNIDVHFIMA